MIRGLWPTKAFHFVKVFTLGWSSHLAMSLNRSLCQSRNINQLRPTCFLFFDVLWLSICSLSTLLFVLIQHLILVVNHYTFLLLKHHVVVIQPAPWLAQPHVCFLAIHMVCFIDPKTCDVTLMWHHSAGFGQVIPRWHFACESRPQWGERKKPDLVRLNGSKCGYGHLLAITGYKWDYPFHRWGYK